MNAHYHFRYSLRLAAVFLALAGLVSCGDNSALPGYPDAGSGYLDAGPAPDADIPPECQASAGKRGHGFGEKIIYHNELETDPLMFNALTSNPQAQTQLVASKLHSDTFDRTSAGANDYLIDQLTDAWSQRMFSFLVACALPEGQEVMWQHPVTGETHTWTGERGFCPEWHDGGVAGNTTCQELVSACLLATNNAYGEQVRISMRGLQAGASLPLEEAASSGVFHDTVSVQECDAGAPSGDTSRDCGWQPESVGTCRPGIDVQLDPAATCEGDMMLRVCDGLTACDPAEDVQAGAGFCAGGAVSFACPDSGKFTVMSAPSEPGGAGTVDIAATKAIYPVAEPKLFSVREGAFYGNIFLGPDGVNPRIGVRVEDGQVIYSFTPDPAEPPQDYPIYDTACSGVDGVDEADLRRARHAQFIAQVQELISDDITVYPRLYTCWDPGWTAGAAYESKRVCTGPEGQQFCAAKPVGSCWDGLGSQANQCASADNSDGADVTAGDRDYSGCEGALGDVWQNPVTVFLDDPCTVVTDPVACAVRRVRSVVTGAHHTCVLTSTGEVRCWGYNANGQLGHGNTDNIGDDEAAAAAGSVDIGGTVTQLVTGGVHTCALLDTGNVRCWGGNFYGQLGYGVAGDRRSPTGDVPVGAKVVQIAAGGYHTCALLEDTDGTGGAVRCWGDNKYGQLGYARTDLIGDDETPADVGDVAVDASAKVIQLAAGRDHTCALLDNGKVRCWGRVEGGRLGYGALVTEDIGDTETPASLGSTYVDTGVDSVVQISSYYDHTCALDAGGEVWCWGLGAEGRLGYGGIDNIGDDETPASVGPVAVEGTVTQVAAGFGFTCVLLDNDDIRCWGSNEYGQLGNAGDPGAGSIDLGRAVLQPSAGLPTIAAGVWHHCAVVDTGNVRCWGHAGNGQLGYGSTANIGDDEVPALAADVPVY